MSSIFDTRTGAEAGAIIARKSSGERSSHPAAIGALPERREIVELGGLLYRPINRPVPDMIDPDESASAALAL